jgi:type IV pilus assembly protein PilP
MRRERFLPLPLLLAAVALVLSACGGSDEQDIREWMKEQSKDLRGRVPDLPQIKPLPVLAYEPGDLSSPFSPDKVFAGDTKVGGVGAPVVSGGPKDINADAQPMTKYPLESIRLVGTILVGKELRAIVASEREPVRQVHIGDYLGQNHGRITAIEPAAGDSQGRILLKEVVLDKGIWIERETQLPPQDQRR